MKTKRCQSCGGVLGKDCFNPDECSMIEEMQKEDIHKKQTARHKRLVIGDVISALLLESRELEKESQHKGKILGSFYLPDSDPDLIKSKALKLAAETIKKYYKS